MLKRIFYFYWLLVNLPNAAVSGRWCAAVPGLDPSFRFDSCCPFPSHILFFAYATRCLEFSRVNSALPYPTLYFDGILLCMNPSVLFISVFVIRVLELLV
jgi:hypothetical protein